jgi:pimeloyl-ACP methyl ester carboxylesterase
MELHQQNVDGCKLTWLPMLIVNAKHDPIAPPQCGRNILKIMPHARYVEFADASHALPITHADKVNQILDEHFCEVK